MNQRVNPFADLAEVPVFEPKPKKEVPVATEAIERIAAENKFPSRQARKAQTTTGRPPRIYRTGRNRHFSIKATNATVERFYKMADEQNVTLGRLLELALDALERAGAKSPE